MRLSSWLRGLWSGSELLSGLGDRTQRGRTQRRRRGSVGRPATTGGVEAEVLEVRLVPAVLTVNSLADTDNFNSFGGQFGFGSDNVLTFREALHIVNSRDTFGYSVIERLQVDTSNGALGVNDTIQFAPSLTASGAQTISMTGGEYGISRNVTILGRRADLLSFDARLQSRIFNNSFHDVTFEIGGLTLKNGNVAIGDGGVIRNSGTLTLRGVAVTGGKAEATGGGIFNNGTLNLVNSTIRNSFAISGGAIENLATLNVTEESTIEQNVARLGAGINNTGSVTVKSSTFSTNVAQPDSIGVLLGVGGKGGGINNQGGQVTVLDSTFVGNGATGVNAKGGAINNENNGHLYVLNSTISGNLAATSGGGIFNNAEAVIYNSTFFGNVANQDGGAIFNQTNLTLLNATLTNNFANAGAGLFTKVFNKAPFASSIVFNTIISGNLSLPDNNNQRTSQNLGGHALDSGSSNNLINGDVTAIFELENGVPELADNGGPTETVALKSDSLAFNQGLSLSSTTIQFSPPPEFTTQAAINALLATDQRGTGFTRNFGGGIDIGAFELSEQTSLKVTASGPSSSVLTSDTVTLNFTVKNISTVIARDVVLALEIPDDVAEGAIADATNIKVSLPGSVFNGESGKVKIQVTTDKNFVSSFEPGDVGTIRVRFTLKSSAAGKTLEFTPVVTTETFHAEIVNPTVSVQVLALPTLPAFTGISHDAEGNQTSVGGPSPSPSQSLPRRTAGKRRRSIPPASLLLTSRLWEQPRPKLAPSALATKVLA